MSNSAISSDQIERIRILLDSRRNLDHDAKESTENIEENREIECKKWEEEAKNLLENLLTNNPALLLQSLLDSNSLKEKPTEENKEEKKADNQEDKKRVKEERKKLRRSLRKSGEEQKSNDSSPSSTPKESLSPISLSASAELENGEKKQNPESPSPSSSPQSRPKGTKKQANRNPSFMTLPLPQKEEFDKQSLRDAAKDLANFETKEAPASPLVSAVRKGVLEEPIKQLKQTEAMRNIPKVMVKSASENTDSGQLSPVTPRRTLVQLVEQMKTSATHPIPLIFGQYFSSKELIEWLEDYSVREWNSKKDFMFNKEDAPLIAQQLYDLKFIKFVESIDTLSSEKMVFQGKVLSDPLLLLRFSLKEIEKETVSSPTPPVKESEFITKVLRNPIQCMLLHMYLRQYHFSYILTMWVETEILRTRGSRKPSMSSQEITARITNIYARFLSSKSATRLRLTDSNKTAAENSFSDVRMDQLAKAFIEKKVEKDREKVLYELQNDVAKYLYHCQLPKFTKSIFQATNNELNEFHYYLFINKLRDKATGPLVRERKIKDVTCNSALTGYEIIEWLSSFIYFENRDSAVQFINQLVKNHSQFTLKVYYQNISNGRLDLTNYWSSGNSVGPMMLFELESDFRIRDDSNFFYSFPLPIRPPSKKPPKEGRHQLQKFQASLSRRKILQNMREYKTESFDASATPPTPNNELDPQKIPSASSFSDQPDSTSPSANTSTPVGSRASVSGLSLPLHRLRTESITDSSSDSFMSPRTLLQVSDVPEANQPIVNSSAPGNLQSSKEEFKSLGSFKEEDTLKKRRTGSASKPYIATQEVIKRSQSQSDGNVGDLQDEMYTKYKEGFVLFNDRPLKGIDWFIKNNVLKKDPEEVAHFLMESKHLTKTKIGEYLGENDEFVLSVLEAFIGLLDFSCLDFDVALRHMANCFRLPGEAQKIDRILQRFSLQYYNQNQSEDFVNADSAWALAFATIMLNVDSHSNKVKKRMTKPQFIHNCRGINEGQNFAPEILEEIYDRITTEEIKLTADTAGPISIFSAAMKKGWAYARITQNSKSIAKWKRYYWVLLPDLLLQFKKQGDDEIVGCYEVPDLKIHNKRMAVKERRLCIQLEGKETMVDRELNSHGQITVSKASKRKSKIVVDDIVEIILSFNTERELNGWVRVFQRFVDGVVETRRSPALSNASNSELTASNSASRVSNDTTAEEDPRNERAISF